ncbi:MAG: ATP synthase F1 subunit delta [Planctomycetota bacterium]
MNVSQAVARVYAEALSDLGEDQDNLPRIVDDLHAVRRLFDEDRTFREFFGSPRLDPTAKKRILQTALGERIDRPVMGLLHILVEKRREMLLDNIADEFQRHRDLREGRLHAYVTTARPVDDDQQAEIVSRLERATGKSILIHQRIDPRTLGGIRIQFGDRVIDGTVRRRLQQLRRVLVPTRG